jgi:hypothetical protein
VIQHPSAATLLQRHGTTLAGRNAARADLAAEITRRGNDEIEWAIRSAGRTFACVQAWHVSCASIGNEATRAAACLCECHDPEEPRTDV